MINIKKPTWSLIAAISLSLIVPGSASAETLNLRMSVESTPGASTQYMLASFRDALKIEMGDDVAIEYFDSGTLGDEIVHMQQVRTGQLDIIPIGSDAVQLDNSFAVFDIPFLFSSREKVSAVLDGPIGDELDASLQEKAGLKVLGFGEIGFRHITNNVRPIIKPEDLSGLKLRTPGSKTRMLSFSMLGASPIKMNMGEIYLALQQGVIDGQENPFGNIRKKSWFEVQKFISKSRHVYTPITFVMNLKRYDSLTAKQKEQVHKAARTAALDSRQYGANNDATLEQEIRDLAPDVKFNDIDSDAFKAAAGPIAEKIGEIAGKDFTAKFVGAATN
ncbi:MAG: TRAP transporter substrate-binding protein [Paracoccaceae bacterium]|jgi:TRAP-type transport system periplasmic protein|nr:TRAP transporter substrate-binding protein [Paracoccaceae bacterium]